MPYIAILFDQQISEYFRTGIIAVLFIAGGINLMMGSKEKVVTASVPVKDDPTELRNATVKGVEE
jgi:hypothetical protein